MGAPAEAAVPARAPDVILTVADGIGRIVIRQPARRNAMNMAMWRRMAAILAELAVRDDARLVTFEGAGEDAFCSGGDITEYPAFAAEADLARDFHAIYGAVLAAIRGLDRPTLALIKGACYGAGLAIAAACDFRAARDDSHFGITALRRGLVYPLAEIRQLQALAGLGAVRRLILHGERLDAAQALRVHLVDHVWGASEFDARSAALAGELLAQSGRAYGLTKRLIDESVFGSGREDETLRAIALSTYEEAEFRDGTRAFLDGETGKPAAARPTGAA